VQIAYSGMSGEDGGNLQARKGRAEQHSHLEQRVDWDHQSFLISQFYAEVFDPLVQMTGSRLD
jgi:hypothetical protein